MTPIKFKGHNIIIAKDQPEYKQLPAFRSNKGEVVSCWKLSLWERIKILCSGKIWMMMLCFDGPVTPSLLTTKKKDLIQ